MSIVDLDQDKRAAFAMYFYGHRASLNKALAMAGLSYLDQEAALFVRPNMPINAEILDNGDIIIRRRWQRPVR